MFVKHFNHLWIFRHVVFRMPGCRFVKHVWKLVSIIHKPFGLILAYLYHASTSPNICSPLHFGFGHTITFVPSTYLNGVLHNLHLRICSFFCFCFDTPGISANEKYLVPLFSIRNSYAPPFNLFFISFPNLAFGIICAGIIMS